MGNDVGERRSSAVEDYLKAILKLEEEGERATITHVPDESTDVLRYLAELSLVPGEDVEVVVAAPFDGPVTVRAGGAEHALSRELAASIGVA
jgi:Fe2+ transport system protein FeoA